MQSQASTLTENGQATRRERLYFLDWLRVFAILVVFFIHCSKIFDYHTTVVVNTVRSPVLSAYRDFTLLWVMPLFFVISGAAVVLSKGPDNPGEFMFTLNGYSVAKLPAAFSSGTRNISMASMDLAAILRPWDTERICGIWNSSLSTH